MNVLASDSTLDTLWLYPADALTESITVPLDGDALFKETAL